jgi:hypothetical protein
MIKMPNVSSNAKFGRSMDYSQFLDIKRRYKNVQEQVATSAPGIQSQTRKGKFNENRVNGGSGNTNGAVNLYFVKGLTTVFKAKKLF